MALSPGNLSDSDKTEGALWRSKIEIDGTKNGQKESEYPQNIWYFTIHDQNG